MSRRTTRTKLTEVNSIDIVLPSDLLVILRIAHRLFAEE